MNRLAPLFLACALTTGCAWFGQQARGVDVMPKAGTYEFAAVGDASSKWKGLADGQGRLAVDLKFAPAGSVDATVPGTATGTGTWKDGRCQFTLRKTGGFAVNELAYDFQLVIVSDAKFAGEVYVKSVDTRSQQRDGFGNASTSSSSISGSLNFTSDQTVTGTLR